MIKLEHRPIGQGAIPIIYGAGTRADEMRNDMARSICTIEGCESVVHGHGFCSKHYTRWRNYGDPINGRAPDRVKQACSATDCDNPARTRGLCHKHYYRLRKHGDTEIVSITRHPGGPAERFWAKVDQSSECWLWLGHVNAGGYGTFRVDGKMALAYRFGYELVRGDVPSGLFLGHICGVRACVNPEHLRIVTRKQNGENLTVIQSNNTSGVRGVSWSKDAGKWRVSVGHYGKLHHGGRFADIKDAEAAAINLRNKLYTHNDRDREESA